MDNCKKLRKTARAAFTRTYNWLSTNISRDAAIEDIQAQFALLKDKASEIEDLNDKLQQLLLDQEEMTDQALEEESATCDEYRLKYYRIKTQVTNLMQPMPPIANDGEAVQPRNRRDNEQATQDKRFKLPKIELQKFSGELREWLQFWSLFKNIHEDQQITKEDKFQYLVQAMVKDSRASDFVNSYPPIAENYDKVIDSLKSRFGKSDLLIELYVRELLKLVLNNTTKSGKKPSVGNLFDKLETQLRALESLGVTTEMCAAMLYPLVESSLPEETLRVWQRSPASSGAAVAKDRLTNLMSFLAKEVQAEQRIEMVVSGFGITSEAKVKDRNKRTKQEASETPTAAGLLTVNETIDSKCIFCDERHNCVNCEKAKKLSLAERQEIVKEKRACFCCAKIGHNLKSCRYKGKCAWCGHRHILLLCRSVASNTSSSGSKAKTDTQQKDVVENLSNLSSGPEVFMQTLMVKVYNDNQEQLIRAVVDSGSHHSYISADVAAKMQFKETGNRTMIHSLFGGVSTQPLDHKRYLVCLRSLDGGYACNFNAFEQNKICVNIPRVTGGSWIKELSRKSINLTDANHDEVPISLLIGADVAGRLLTGRIVQLDNGVTAVDTKFGWTIMGKNPSHVCQHNDSVAIAFSMYVDEAKIEDLWNLDVLGIQDPIQKSTKEQHQENVLKGFRHSTIINEQGRYEVCLPWKENHPTLPMNRATAERRLESTIKKLKQDGLNQAYDDVFQDWLNDGIIEELSSNEAKDYGHYLPHRHVVKENSTTRIRPVFDASSRERGGPSLNQCLETGPNFIELIPELLLRFRLHKFGVIADIRKAFLQISVSKQDRDVMKFLWKRRPEDTEFVVYRHCRVVFGVSSSPFLLGATIDLHLENVARDLPKEEINLIRDLAKSFYVDNSITSHPTVDEVKGFKEKATLYMSKGGFDLRGWEYSGDMNPSTETPVLGLVWDKGEDILKISGHCLQPRIPEVVTKRKILAATQKVFDPIGIVCPVLLCPKLILQALWTKKTNWDETVDEETGAAFVKWLRDLKLLREVRIPRWAFGGTNDFLSLHLFVDASQAAYAAVIFVRVVCSQGIKVHLVQAKSRLAPLGKPTIPRLELMGAVIGARLLCSTIKYLNRPEVKVYCWTDSSTVLAWIKRESQWATFVWRRVQEIRQLTEPDDWRHVPGDLNPADLPSRGCSARELIKTKWWLGPQWLSRPEEEWPLFDAEIDEDAVRSEMKKGTVRSKVVQISSVLVANATGHESRASGEMVIPDTSYEGILRRLAWIMRFVANCRLEASKRVRSYLRVKKVTAAELKLIRMVQRESFFGFKDSRMKLMNTYLDEDGIIRLKSPVANRDDTMDFRHPILLDSRHSLVNKLIEYTHLRLNHAPASIMINALREKFWILGCRRGVNAVIHSCVSCRRFNVKRVETLSPALPGKRVRDAAVFEITGMDYAGPLFLRDKTKAWVCLFTCAIYRAVHFELVSSLTTENFLEAFRRFVSRRGRPSYVYTDNGTNFVGANNLLQSIDWRKVERYGVVERIQWQFNPPSAAWWGGWWERMVRSMKDMLRKVLGRAALNFEEVTTVLCDCEAVINSRPLTYLAEDTCQLVPLSPLLFLHELKNDRLPDVDIAITTQKITARLRYIQELREALRKRFRIEYLGQLKQCPSMRSTTSTLKVGDVVLIGNDLQKRLDWPLARIIELIPGIDGETRVVRLKTATGKLIRPVQRVFPLEVHSGEESSDELRACHQSKKKSSEKAETVPANETCEMRKDADVEKPETRTRYGRLVKPPCRFKL